MAACILCARDLQNGLTSLVLIKGAEALRRHQALEHPDPLVREAVSTLTAIRYFEFTQTVLLAGARDDVAQLFDKRLREAKDLAWLRQALTADAEVAMDLNAPLATAEGAVNDPAFLTIAGNAFDGPMAKAAIARRKASSPDVAARANKLIDSIMNRIASAAYFRTMLAEYTAELKATLEP